MEYEVIQRGTTKLHWRVSLGKASAAEFWSTILSFVLLHYVDLPPQVRFETVLAINETLTWGNMAVVDFLPACVRASDWHNVMRVRAFAFVCMDIAVLLPPVNSHKRMVSRRIIHSCTGLKQTVLMAASPLGTPNFPNLSIRIAIYSYRLSLFFLVLQPDPIGFCWHNPGRKSGSLGDGGKIW
jgi:hypothetical protein